LSTQKTQITPPRKTIVDRALNGRTADCREKEEKKEEAASRAKKKNGGVGRLHADSPTFRKEGKKE